MYVYLDLGVFPCRFICGADDYPHRSHYWLSQSTTNARISAWRRKGLIKGSQVDSNHLGHISHLCRKILQDVQTSSRVSLPSCLHEGTAQRPGDISVFIKHHPFGKEIGSVGGHFKPRFHPRFDNQSNSSHRMLLSLFFYVWYDK